MQLRCPVSGNHMMVEIAPQLYQCPDCGTGPTEFWALGNVEVDDDVVGALQVTWRQDLECYVAAAVSWQVDARGWRVPQTLASTLFGYVSTAAELAQAPLPVRGEGARLRAGMFSSPLGEKTSQTGARTGRSGAAHAPAGPSEGSPRHRRKAGK